MKQLFAAGRLLARTMDHVCIEEEDLPTFGATTLIWPNRPMVLFGKSTRRLAALYDHDACEIGKYHPTDAHTTYTEDQASHAPTISRSELEESLLVSDEHAARPSQCLYNEVSVNRLGPVLGFALIKPYDILQLEWEAKKMALAWFDRHADTSTIVFFCETSGTVA
jgi:hypothetical protein